MRVPCLLFFTCLVLLSACAGKDKRKSSKKEKNHPFLINLQHFNTDSENYMSFPIWFDASEIKKNKISKITRQVFHVSGNTSEEGEENQLDIREIKIYQFNSDGKLMHLLVSFFYDDRNICEIIFNYDGELDSWGYSANVTREINTKDEIGFNESELPFHLFKFIKSTKKSLTYYSLKDKQLYHYMTNEEFHGPLSVDSILHPKPKDLIFLGSPKFPTKKYQVTNKVHETNVRNFTYKENQFESMTKNDFPFTTKRNVIRNKKGEVDQMIDSLFSQNNFLTRTLFLFEKNDKNLPIAIKRVKENSSAELVQISLEKLDYEYYEKH